MSDPLLMSNLPTWLATPNVISSPESADGLSLPDWLAGPMTVPCGPRPARASRSRSQGKVKEPPIQGTFGRTFSDSPVPSGPLSSWESRLRQRLAKIGSSECDLTWKVSAMSDGALLSRLVPSMPRTVEIDSGLLLGANHWATPTACMSKGSSEGALTRMSGKSRANDRLDHQVLAMAMWPTPSASGFEAKDAQTLLDRLDRCKESTGNGNGFGLTLGQFACLESAMWLTATAVDGARGLTTRPQDTGIPLPQRVGQVLGIPPTGLSDTTGKRGVLNPAFPCWLMGYPLAHLSCGVTAMQSSHRSRQK